MGDAWIADGWRKWGIERESYAVGTDTHVAILMIIGRCQP